MAVVPSGQNESTAVLSGAGSAENVRSEVLSVRHRPRSDLVRTVERLYTTAVALIIVPLALPVFGILTTRRARRVLLAIAVLIFRCKFRNTFFFERIWRTSVSLGRLQISLTNIALIRIVRCVVCRDRNSVPIVSKTAARFSVDTYMTKLTCLYEGLASDSPGSNRTLGVRSQVTTCVHAFHECISDLPKLLQQDKSKHIKK